jgi:FkbM family methyltransferase
MARMMNVLRRLREWPPANVAVRAALMLGRRVSSGVERGIASWPPTGLVTIRKAGLTFRLHAHPRDNVAARVFWSPEGWETHEYDLFLSLARQAQVILDIGANIGLYSLGARLVNPRARLLAFEPNPVNVAQLRRNLAVNDLLDVEVHPVALGATAAELPFYVLADDRPLDASNIGSADFIRKVYPDVEVKELRVPVVALDEVLRAERVVKVDLIKLDVEFYEHQVLRGASKMLARDRPLVMCELHHPDELMHRLGAGLNDEQLRCGSRVFETFSDLGYTCLVPGPQGLFRAATAPMPGHPNVLFVPQAPSGDFIPYARAAALLMAKTRT